MGVEREILHVDMDAFYASVEVLDRPELAGKPVIVGGRAKERGVVAAASYEVRRFGVHSAMATARAMKLCPQAILLPVRMSRYAEISRQIREIFGRYTPLVEPLSLDEAFLDVTGSSHLFGGAVETGRAIKRTIREETGLTASVGVAPNKFLAKLASDLDKPDGFTVITAENVHEVLDPLGVGRIWGVGKVTEKALKQAGIETVGQLRRTGAGTLRAIVGNFAEDLLRLASGQDERPVETEHVIKSISVEETFAEDIADADKLRAVLGGQVEEVAAKLRRKGLFARTVTLKLRYGDFRTITRSGTLKEPTDRTQRLREEARAIFDAWHRRQGGALRLLGFGVSGLTEVGPQKGLFDEEAGGGDEKQGRLDRTVDDIRSRFGKGSLRRGE